MNRREQDAHEAVEAFLDRGVAILAERGVTASRSDVGRVLDAYESTALNERDAALAENARLRAGRLRSAPISAPMWLWLAYGAIVVALGVVSGSANGFACVWFSAAFSFQFWTFAVWRGYTRHTLAAPTADDGAERGGEVSEFSDCPTCGRTKKDCDDSAARGWDACCMTCDEIGRAPNHRILDGAEGSRAEP